MKKELSRTGKYFAALAGLMVLSAPVAFAGDMKAGIAKYNAKQYQAALNDFKDVAKANPKDGLCHYYMALCNQCLARVGEAKAEYEKVMQLGPENLKPNAQKGLDLLSKVTGRTGGVSGSPTAVASTAGAGTAAPGTAAGAAAGTAGATAGGDKAKEAKDKEAAKKELPNVKQVILFYSESSPASISMESTWDDAKLKYKGIEFTRLNVADNSNAELISKYGVSNYPTTVVIDQAGKVLHNQAGPIIGDGFTSMMDGYLKKK